MEFHVGQRVKVTCNIGNIGFNKEVGTIISTLSPLTASYGVSFDRNVGGHSCGGKCPNGHGWWLPPSVLAPVDFSPLGLEELI